MSESSPILLSGYAAKQCARRIHNDFDPTLEQEEADPSPQQQMLFDAGNAHERRIFQELQEALGSQRCRDLTGVRARSAAITATVSAMKDDVEVILGGWLPDDIDGGRKGRPDLLVRSTLRGDGIRSYLPGDVKGHRTIKPAKNKRLMYSTFEAPTECCEVESYASMGRFDDLVQLAHYWRLLQACGRAPDRGTPTGLLIGSDPAPLGELNRLFVWHDLSAPTFTTFSRSSGTASRSALERYDHEHGFRLQVAQVAASRSRGEDDAAPLVAPVFTNECDACPWYTYCREVAGQDSASAHITSGRLSIREWKALSALGVSTLEQVAELVIDQRFQDQYLPEVTHVKAPLGRLNDAVRRARMIRAGVSLERLTSGRVPLPRTEVEIDFDIEWDDKDRVYLWGAWVHRPGEAPYYHSTVSWEPLDEAAESDLAKKFADWLQSLIGQCDAANQSVAIFHYSDPEPRYLRRVLGTAAVDDLTKHFFDLLPVIRTHFFGVNGLSIKQVAPAFGFGWRDHDPGGLQSQVWLQEARGPEADPVTHEARTRILNYNEDDVLATVAVRAGIRAT